jgi:hypothetical protein
MFTFSSCSILVYRATATPHSDWLWVLHTTIFLQAAGWPALASGQKWTCTFANDFDEVKAAAYRGYHGGLALIVEDVRRVKSKELRDAANLSRPSPAIFKLAFPGLVSSASVPPSFELCS